MKIFSFPKTDLLPSNAPKTLSNTANSVISFTTLDQLDMMPFKLDPRTIHKE